MHEAGNFGLFGHCLRHPGTSPFPGVVLARVNYPIWLEFFAKTPQRRFEQDALDDCATVLVDVSSHEDRQVLTFML